MMLGLGAYPFYTDPQPGLGPTKSAPEENGIAKGSEADEIEEVHRDTHRCSIVTCDHLITGNVCQLIIIATLCSELYLYHECGPVYMQRL